MELLTTTPILIGDAFSSALNSTAGKLMRFKGQGHETLKWAKSGMVGEI
jgi:hypothetical protein